MEEDYNMECGFHLRLCRLIESMNMSMCVLRLEELLKAFLEDTDPDAELSLGPDMRKIHQCFFLLKVMYYKSYCINSDMSAYTI